MNRASLWRNSPSAKRSLGAIVIFCCLLPALLAQGDPQLQFVKILPTKPGAYGPPSRFGPGETLGLRIGGIPSQEGVKLELHALVNRSPGRPYEKNEMVSLASIGSADLRKQNISTDASELVVPFSTLDTHDVLEITARFVGKSGEPLGRPAKLTLDLAASVQAGPSLLQKAMAGGSTLLDRLMNIYQDVREAGEPRSIFSVSLERGKISSAPVLLSLQRAQFQYLAISPEGKRLAWVTEEQQGHYALWAANLEKLTPVKIALSTEEIVTPLFVDEDLLLYVNGSSLIRTSTENPRGPQAIHTPFRAVARIDYAKRNEDQIECIVSAEHLDSPNVNLPYLARISASGQEIAIFRLPVNPFYRSYSLLVEGAPLFFAGSEGGVEGIHYFRADAPEGQVTTLYKVRSPGLVALAANGSRLVFAGAQ